MITSPNAMRARSSSKVSLEAGSPLPVVRMCPHQSWLSTAFNHSPREASLANPNARASTTTTSCLHLLSKASASSVLDRALRSQWLCAASPRSEVRKKSSTSVCPSVLLSTARDGQLESSIFRSALLPTAPASTQHFLIISLESRASALELQVEIENCEIAELRFWVLPPLAMTAESISKFAHARQESFYQTHA